ncbi:MAG: DUF1569 domain-containing protein [Gammaproteobacteria bacterium]|nr:DUF1569 domain-containing protein [Gammaproteobacteria bacterium]
MTDFDDLTEYLQRLEDASSIRVRDGWSVEAVLHHCAQSIDFSVHGFPRYKPTFLRRTVGSLVARKFLRSGAMSHNRKEAIPGAPQAPGDQTLSDSLDAMRTAIATFRDSTVVPREHFILGRLSREQFERIHVMHAANHFEWFEINP